MGPPVVVLESATSHDHLTKLQEAREGTHGRELDAARVRISREGIEARTSLNTAIGPSA